MRYSWVDIADIKKGPQRGKMPVWRTKEVVPGSRAAIAIPGKTQRRACGETAAGKAKYVGGDPRLEKTRTHSKRTAEGATDVIY